MARDDSVGTALLRVAVAPVELAGAVLGLGVEVLRQTRRTLPALGDAVRAVRAVPRLVSALEQLAGAAPALDTLSRATDHLERLAAVGDRALEMSDADEVREHVLRALTATTQIAAAVTTLDPLPERVDGLNRAVGTVADRLGEVEPDLTDLARMIAALDESIKILATAVAPLQGTTERLGRLVDRLPDRRRKQVGGPTS